MHSNELLAYRPDIDGLRAVAVLAVVLYHLGIGPLKGGFVGVDIFFVISGFLITGIVQREIDQGRFTFTGFYRRRVRRLFPALFVMLLATLLVGIAVLLPTDLVFLGKATVATLLFGSNVLYWRTSGYFDSASEINPLLHTWSLAVEEQFYIGFPILLLVVHRYARTHLKLFLWIVTASTFAACVWTQSSRPTATFYLAPFRAWELSIGALLAVGAVPNIGTRWWRECLSAMGMFLVGYSLVSVEAGIEFPGWQVALPVLGAAMLICSGNSGGSWTDALLRSKVMVAIGLMSYSLYLWHWPLLVYARYFNGLEPLGSVRWAVMAVAMLIAAGSYLLIETPFRQMELGRQSKLLFVGSLVLAMPLLITGLLVVSNGGAPARFESHVVAIDRERMPDIPFRECVDRPLYATLRHDFCVLGGQHSRPTILFWGDSHALAWAPALDRILAQRGLSAMFAGRSSCAPLVGIINPVNVDCHDHNSAVMNYLAELPQVSMVVLVASWTAYANDPGFYSLEDDEGRRGNRVVFPTAMTKTIRQLRELGKRVWIIGPTPASPTDPLRMALVALTRAPPPPIRSTHEYAESVASFYVALEGMPRDGFITVTDPGPWLCDALSCQYSIGGLPLYRDGGHLNVRGAQYLQPYLAAAFEGALHGTMSTGERTLSGHVWKDQ